jgi:cysteine desulfurase
MQPPRLYLDWNATAPLRPEARAAMLAALDVTGNPSSVHAEGRKTRAIVDKARAQVAALVGAEPHNVVFTGSATEAAAQVLSRHWHGDGIARPAGRLYVSAIEHLCVLAGGQFAPEDVTKIAVTSTGILDITAIKQHLTDHDPALGRPLVALMLANNETGILQPVPDAAALVHAAGGYLICDAVQAAGRIPIDLKTLGADAIFLSAHKLGGPKGAGALILADEGVAPAALIRGGGQERGLRAGTENVAGIAGFGAAAEAALAGLKNMPRLSAFRDTLEAGFLTPFALDKSPVQLDQNRVESDENGFSSGSNRIETDRPAGKPQKSAPTRKLQRLPNTALLSIPGAKSETLVIQLDLAGIAVSAGSACSSGKVKRSHVLDAMGVDPDIAEGTIRVSLGPTTTEADVERFRAVWSGLQRGQ